MRSLGSYQPRWLPILFTLGFVSLLTLAPARVLDLKPLSPQKMESLPKEALHEYQLGMTSVDKINYAEGLDHFRQAVEAAPDNVYLRFMVVQLAQYLGEARSTCTFIQGSPDPAKYFDVALENIKEILRSPKLTPREKERAQGAMDDLTKLRQSITERDEKRQQYGKEVAKQYAAEMFKDEDKEGSKGSKGAKGSKSSTKSSKSTSSKNGSNSVNATGNYSNRKSSSAQ